MAKSASVAWADAPASDDYPAAVSYLRLIGSPALAEVLTSLLSRAPTVSQHAKDILRAARLPLLPSDDPEVVKDLRRWPRGGPVTDPARAWGIQCRPRSADC